jgi:GNAT superfamily N-acetyltransferase
MDEAPKIVISHRRLTQAEARCIHRELRETHNILGYTVRELVRLKDVHAAECDGAFAGATWSVDLPFGWTEISAIIVLAEHRGKGIGRSLFEIAWRRAAERGRSVYMLSRNAQVMEWMREKGMSVDERFWSAPLAVHLHAPLYMASWYRHVEIARKWRQIRACPRIVQGVLRR